MFIVYFQQHATDFKTADDQLFNRIPGHFGLPGTTWNPPWVGGASRGRETGASESQNEYV
jgi:hypothetical protein